MILTMSHTALFDNASTPPCLFVRDARGRYTTATPDDVLTAARAAIDHKVARGASMSSPETVKRYLISKLAGYSHEVFAVLMLDAHHRLIQYVEMFHGTICSTAVYPRAVVIAALKHEAAAIIFAHNHPSGCPDPSKADIDLTRILKQSLDTVDVRTLDHIIVGGHETTSLTERGLI